jgi:c-di-GMP-binding flagellar brake protein YcgR
MKFRERREYSRAEVEWPVNISAAQRVIQGTVINMSLGGAYIRLEKLPNMNENLNLSIEIPEYQYAVFATGETIRFEINPSENTPVSYGLGVRLKDMAEDDLEFLSTTVLR